MVVSELALTIVLLCGAGLMLRSFIALYAVPPGFTVEGLARMRMQLPPSNYPTPEARQRFFDQLLPKVEAIAGIQSAAITTRDAPRSRCGASSSTASRSEITSGHVLSDGRGVTGATSRDLGVG